MSKPVNFRGRSYPSLKKLAEQHAGEGISYPMVQARLKLGWALEDALSKPKNPSADRVFVVGGEEYPSLAALAEAAGLKYNAAYRRFKRGFTDEEIFHGKKRKRKNPPAKKDKSRTARSVCVDGKAYKSIREAYDTLCPDIAYNTVRQRITTYGWSDDEAFGFAQRKEGRQGWKLSQPRKGLKSVWVNGIEYGSALTAFREIGKVSMSTYQARMLAGLDLAVCLGLAPHPKDERYLVFGQSYGTIEEVASAYGIAKSTLTGRMNKMPLEDAILHTPHNGRFNETAFSRDPELAARQALLYFISIEVDGEIFQKVGITTRSVEQRFPLNNLEVHLEKKGTLEELHRTEERCMQRYREFVDSAPEGFEGRTETFKMPPDTIREVIGWL